MNRAYYSDLLDSLKKQAMVLANAGQGGYLKLLENLVRQNHFVSLHQLQQLAKAEALALAAGAVQVLESTPGMPSLYRVDVNGSTWSLQALKYGPVLCLEDRPHGHIWEESRTSDLGLFQVLVKATAMPDNRLNYPKHGWVVTRYGQYRTHTAEFLSDEDAKALSYQFGIPFASKSFSPRAQQERSEICFLKSPAFASLRIAMRCGTISLPAMKSWTYGLCSIWPHLVAMSDDDFKDVERILDWCFEIPRNVKLPHDSLFKQWGQIPNLGLSGKGIGGGLGEMFRLQDAVRKARARNVKQVRNAGRLQKPT